MNPYQGLGNYSYPVNYWLSPASLITYLLSPNIPNVLIHYVVIGLELFTTLWIIAESIQVDRTLKIFVSWYSVVAVMPFITNGNYSFYPISHVIPWVIEYIAFCALCLILVMKLLESTKKSSLIYILLIVGFLYYSTSTYTYGSIIFLPIFFFYSFVLASLSIFKLQLGKKKIILNFIALIISSLLPVIFIASLLMYSVPTFFNSELSQTYDPSGFTFISLIFHWGSNGGVLSGATSMLALWGSIKCLSNKNLQIQFLAIFYLICELTLISFGLTISYFGIAYRGPAMLYFEWFLWPFMFIFSSIAIFSLLNSSPIKKIYSTYEGTVSVIMILSVLVITSLIIGREKTNAFMSPQVRSLFVQILAEQIAIKPGSSWRGSVATFNGDKFLGLPGGENASWITNSAYDQELWMAIGNDHRASGLWLFNIPTLFSYTQFMSPDYYYMLTRLMAKPTDKQTRNVVVITKPDNRVLALLGVRYIISNISGLEKVSDAKLIESINWPCQGMICQDSQLANHQYLYEIPDANVGNYSPINQVQSDNAIETINLIRSNKFNPKYDVILAHPINKNLEPITESNLILHKNGYRVTARSPGSSILVLPFQYSNCLVMHDNIKNLDKKNIFRANLSLVGIYFENKIDVDINFRAGLMTNPVCKFKDYYDLKKMDLK